MFNHFGTVSAIVGVWFGAMCVSGVDDPLPKRQTIGICDCHEDLSSCLAVPEAIKKPICVRIDLSMQSEYFWR